MNWQNQRNAQLVKAFLALDNPDEVKRFLRDLLTEKEIEEFAKRFQAAEMLSSDVPYLTISKQTGLSSTTVARVAKFLRGKDGGYAAIIAKLHHQDPPEPGRGLS
jgi:TrpR-related protein YerC/YecD